MTFLEALRTGKPMRRKAWQWAESWLVVSANGGCRQRSYGGGTVPAAGPSRADMLSEDWEVMTDAG